MGDVRLRFVGEMALRFAAWVILAIGQVSVIGMWNDAKYPRE